MKPASRQAPTLLDTSEFVKSPLKRSLYGLVQPTIEALLGINKLNWIYKNTHGIEDPAKFCEKALQLMDVKFEIPEEAVERLKKVEGPLVLVSNHPFGGIEALVLIILMKQIRPDFKVMANFMLGRIKELTPFFITVDPFGGDGAKRFNAGPMKESLKYLREGGFLGVFPSGEVAALSAKTRKITEPEWNPNIARLIQKTEATVVPVFFRGHNSLLFQIASLINPKLRTSLLIREFVNKDDRGIQFEVGSIITPDKVKQYESAETLMAHLRSKCYILGSRLNQSKLKFKPIKNILKVPTPFEPIIEPVEPRLLVEEIAAAGAEAVLFSQKDIDVLHIHGNERPNLLRELGRLREITFREVGEGTGKSYDVDRFDNWYEHIVLWNREKQEIVGAYRMGRTDKILEEKGQEGLYTNTLFHIHPHLFRQMDKSLELGRSFVRKEYQRSYAPLLLLWTGIGQFIVRRPQYYSLFGPVSISGDFQTTSKDLMVKFLFENKFAEDLKHLVKPRNPYPFDPQKNVEFYNSFSIKSLNDVQDLISEIETTDMKVPVLLRHYLNMGGKILAFNVDPDFSDVLDGLIYIDLRQTKPDILRKYMGAEGFEVFCKEHAIEA